MYKIEYGLEGVFIANNEEELNIITAGLIIKGFGYNVKQLRSK